MAHVKISLFSAVMFCWCLWVLPLLGGKQQTKDIELSFFFCIYSACGMQSRRRDLQSFISPSFKKIKNCYNNMSIPLGQRAFPWAIRKPSENTHCWVRIIKFSFCICQTCDGPLTDVIIKKPRRYELTPRETCKRRKPEWALQRPLWSGVRVYNCGLREESGIKVLSNWSSFRCFLGTPNPVLEKRERPQGSLVGRSWPLCFMTSKSSALGFADIHAFVESLAIQSYFYSSFMSVSN